MNYIDYGVPEVLPSAVIVKGIVIMWSKGRINDDAVGWIYNYGERMMICESRVF